MHARQREVDVGLRILAPSLENAREVFEHRLAIARTGWDRLEAIAAEESRELGRALERLAPPDVARYPLLCHAVTISVARRALHLASARWLRQRGSRSSRSRRATAC